MTEHPVQPSDPEAGGDPRDAWSPGGDLTLHPLHRILSPRSVTIAGASSNFMKMGTVQALSLLNQGFEGPVSFIHPTEARVLDHPTYRSPLDLPEPVDLAILIVPTAVAPRLLDELGQAGVRRAVIVTAGFREMGAEGERLEQELVEVAGRHGIRFVGPNCIGVINMAAKLNCTYFPNRSTAPGRIGLVSQSGTYVTQVLGWLETQRFGISKAVSVGNQSDLDVVDVLEYLTEAEDVGAIALYLEGLRRGERFVAAARRAAARKPLVGLYAGGSAAGARAGASHTGALAAPDDIVDGIFRQSGIVRVHGVQDLFEQTWLLATQPPMRGRRVGIVTHSGGPAATISDAVEKHGLELPEFSAELQASLMEDLPATAQATNPVDITYLLRLDLLSDALPRKVLTSGEVDGLIIHGLAGSTMGRQMFDNVQRLLPEGTTYEVFKGFLAAADPLAPLLPMIKQHGLPIVHSAFHDRHDETIARLLDGGIPSVESPERAALLLARQHEAWRLGEHICRGADLQAHEHRRTPEPPRAALEILAGAAGRESRVLAEHEAKALLAAWSIPLLPEHVVETAAEAAAAAEALEGPVALKLSAPGLAHKTELGLVRLGLSGRRDVLDAANQLLAGMDERPDARLLVAPMIPELRQLVAGMSRQPGLPSCVLFGWGGQLAEVMRDTAWRLAPFDRHEAEALLGEPRAAGLLGPVRGLPPVNRAALADLLVSLGELGRAHPEIAAVDLNPILVDGAGNPVVVDALIEVGVSRHDPPDLAGKLDKAP